jgi:hypothetical protein
MRMGSKTCRPRALAILGAAVMLLGRGAAFAQETAPAYEDESVQQKIMKKVLGAIGVDVSHKTIDYRERAPLVIPPNADLPPPTTATAPPAEWPKDAQPPRKQVAAKKRQQSSTADKSMWSTVVDGSSEAIDRMFGRTKSESATFRGEPSRTDLTEPPLGYQTPSPNYPYGIAGSAKPPHATAQADTMAPATPPTGGLSPSGGAPAGGMPPSSDAPPGAPSDIAGRRQ